MDYRQNIQGLGYALNDFFSQQGSLAARLDGVANNMPQILSGFAQWGLLLSALLPIIGALLPQLDRLAKSLGFEDAPKFLADTIEILKAKLSELEKHPVKLAIDLVQIREAQVALDKLAKDTASFRQLEEMRTTRQDRSKAAVDKVLKESDAPELAKQLRENEAKRIIASDPAVAEKTQKRDEAKKGAEESERTGQRLLDAGNPGGAAGGYLRTAERLRQEAKEAEDNLRARIDAIRNGNGKDDPGDAARAIGAAKQEAEKGKPGKLQDQLKAAGRKDLAEDLGQTTPEALKLQDELKAKLGQDLTNTVKAAGRQIGEWARKNRERSTLNLENHPVEWGVNFAENHAIESRLNAGPRDPAGVDRPRPGIGRGRPGGVQGDLNGRDVPEPMAPRVNEPEPRHRRQGAGQAAAMPSGEAPMMVMPGQWPAPQAVPNAQGPPRRPPGNDLAVVNDRVQDRPDPPKFKRGTTEARIESANKRNEAKRAQMEHRKSLNASKKQQRAADTKSRILGQKAPGLGGMMRRLNRARPDFDAKGDDPTPESTAEPRVLPAGRPAGPLSMMPPSPPQAPQQAAASITPGPALPPAPRLDGLVQANNAHDEAAQGAFAEMLEATRNTNAKVEEIERREAAKSLAWQRNRAMASQVRQQSERAGRA